MSLLHVFGLEIPDRSLLHFFTTCLYHVSLVAIPLPWSLYYMSLLHVLSTCVCLLRVHVFTTCLYYMSLLTTCLVCVNTHVSAGAIRSGDVEAKKRAFAGHPTAQP